MYDAQTGVSDNEYTRTYTLPESSAAGVAPQPRVTRMVPTDVAGCKPHPLALGMPPPPFEVAPLQLAIGLASPLLQTTYTS